MPSNECITLLPDPCIILCEISKGFAQSSQHCYYHRSLCCFILTLVTITRSVGRLHGCENFDIGSTRYLRSRRLRLHAHPVVSRVPLQLSCQSALHVPCLEGGQHRLRPRARRPGLHAERRIPRLLEGLSGSAGRNPVLWSGLGNQ